jgi:hypothetical protein
LTVPETLALDDGAAEADDAEEAEADGADEVDDELLDELHAAAVNPRNAMPSRAAARLPDDRYVNMMSTIAIATCVTQ